VAKNKNCAKVFFMDNVYKKSISLHKKHHGKIEVVGKIPLMNKNDLSLAYTPGVAKVSLEINKNPKLAFDYTLKHNTVAIISDGSAVLGLGNVGPYAAIPVMEGKALILKKFANIDGFPICLDTNNIEEIISTIKNIAPVFGGIILEDISAPNCFEIENRLRKELSIPVMHDDQHGAAIVTLAGLINALKIRRGNGLDSDMVAPKGNLGLGQRLPLGALKTKIVINGAGAAGTAIIKLLLAYGFKNLLVCDSNGTIHHKRPNLNKEKVELAKITNKNGHEGPLSEIIIGADVFIGVSKEGLLTEEMVRKMAENPIIFALANPIPEIMPEIAKRAGAFIVATGRSDFPNQVNNLLAFPGLFRGALDNKIKQFDQKIFLRAAETLAKYVKNPRKDKILPDPFDLKVVDIIKKTVRAI
jgi:malate dehydrogenase (oxaloacetate-decarboxylating)